MDTPNWRQIIGGTAGIALLGAIGYFGQARVRTDSSPKTFVSKSVKSSKKPIQSDTPVATSSPTSEGDFNMPAPAKQIKVDISGEVTKPGIYELTEGQRVEDLIKLAGGLKKDADRLNINLALKLKDEQKIVVPAQRLPHTWTGPQTNHPESEVNFNWTPAEQKALSKQPKSSKKQPPANPVSINSATEVQLESIPGIGPSMAKKILEYRNANGEYAQIEDLRNIKGMGEKLFEKIREWITL